MKTKLSPFWIFYSIVVCFTACQPKEYADQILYNGTIYTADSLDRMVQAIAVKGDRILQVGTDVEIMHFRGPKTTMQNLEGAFVMPGLIEGHGHFLSLGKSLLQLNLSTTRSWMEIVDKTRDAVAKATLGSWIEGRGWHQEKWIDEAEAKFNGYPYHDALSAVSPNHPVVLVHASGHALIANQKAMDMAGISPESIAPRGGRIVKDQLGKLTGVFEENAMDLINHAMDEAKKKLPSEEKIGFLRQQAQLASQECLKHGITSFQDAGSSLEEIILQKQWCDSGLIANRLWVMLYADETEVQKSMDALPISDETTHRFHAQAVKAYVDGALGSYGAWLLEAYDDKHDHHGQNTMPLDRLNELAEQCLRRNLQLCVHGIGDRANREILNIFEKQLTSDPGHDRRWRIEHAQHLDTADIPRFAALDVIASMQTIHCTSDAPFVEKRLGGFRAKTGAYAWRSLIQSGARMANGTDCPVESINPFECMYAAVTRKRLDNGLPFYTEQKLSRVEALRSYTIWNAYAAFEEKIKGSLEAGKLADLVVLDRNVLQCTDEELATTKVKKVFIGGRTIAQFPVH